MSGFPPLIAGLDLHISTSVGGVGGTLLKHKLRPEQQPFVYKPIGSLQFKLCLHSSIHLKLLLKITTPPKENVN